MGIVSNNRSRLRSIASLSCLAGALCIGGLAFWTNQSLSAEGQIVAVHEMPPRGIAMDAKTVISVRFTDAAGLAHTVPIVYLPRGGASLKTARPGDKVALSYHLSQPEKANLDVFRHHDLYGMAIAFVSLLGFWRLLAVHKA